MDQERAVSGLLPLDLAPTLAGPTAGKGCAADVLDELVSIQGVAEATGALARLHWDDDARVLNAVRGAFCLQHDARPVKCVGVYYHALGTGDAAQADLAALAGSVSFKAGRAVTAPLRFMRDRMGQGHS